MAKRHPTPARGDCVSLFRIRDACALCWRSGRKFGQLETLFHLWFALTAPFWGARQSVRPAGAKPLIF